NFGRFVTSVPVGIATPPGRPLPGRDFLLLDQRASTHGAPGPLRSLPRQRTPDFYFFDPTVQFRTTVMGEDEAPSAIVFTRNRWPSGDTTKWFRKEPMLTAGTRTPNSGTGTAASNVGPPLTSAAISLPSGAR